MSLFIKKQSDKHHDSPVHGLTFKKEKISIRLLGSEKTYAGLQEYKCNEGRRRFVVFFLMLNNRSKLNKNI